MNLCSGMDSRKLQVIRERFCRYYGIEQGELLSDSRTKWLAEHRQSLMYLMHKIAKVQLAAVAAACGRKDHTTVIHACRQVRQRMEHDPDLARQLVTLSIEIKDELMAA